MAVPIAWNFSTCFRVSRNNTRNFICFCGIQRSLPIRNASRSFIKSTSNARNHFIVKNSSLFNQQVANYYVKSKPKDPNALSWKAVFALCTGISCGIGFGISYLGKLYLQLQEND